MIYTAKGGLKRVVAVRMSPGENVMQGLENVCAEYGINNAIILSGMAVWTAVNIWYPFRCRIKKRDMAMAIPSR